MRKMLRKLLSVSLCAALIGGTAAALPVFVPDSGITADAADTLTYGGFEYTVSNGEITITGYTGYGGDVTIPLMIDGKNVTGIGENAFKSCSDITSIVIPDSVTDIGKDAFNSCGNLKSVTMSSNVKKIKSCTFMSCSKLKSIILPQSLTCINNKAFYGCQSLTSIDIPSGVTSIGNNAFFWCTSLASISIPSSVTSIGDSAFYGCSGLTSLTIPSSVTSIGDSAFYKCTSLASISIPSSVTSIGDNAFAHSGLKSLTIQSGVTSIGDSTFAGCTSLANVSIPSSVTSIGNDAFNWCTSLASVSIPSSVTSIGGSAFSSCRGLKSLTIQSGVKSIGKYAFGWCSSLTSISIPSSVTSIGDSAFYDCRGLKSLTIQSGVKSIGNDAFNWCTSLASVNIPDSVTSIGNSAFSSCTSLASISIPSSVTNIKGAFRGCTSLASISIPSSVTNIAGAFSGCTGLTSVSIPSSVTNIAGAFSGCTGLTSVSIPSSVTNIARAFSGCSSLASISIPSSVTSIGEGAFRECTGLTSISIPSGVTSIGDYAFCSCSNLTSITIPSSVTSIGAYALGYEQFEDCPISKRKITICGSIGSTAEKYAKDNGFKFVTDVYDLLKNESTVSESNVALGTRIVLTANASGGKSPYTYAYYYKKSSASSWTAFNKENGSAYSTKTSAGFNPSDPGSYSLRVNVKDSSGTIIQKDFSVTVKDVNPLKNESSVSESRVSLGTRIVLTANASGGTAPYKFAYYYKKSSATSWTAFNKENGSAYSTKTSTGFNPSDTGTYNLKVNVKDSDGNTVSKTFTVEIISLKNESTVSASSVSLGTRIVLTAKASGGTAPYTYAYYYKKSSATSWTAFNKENGSAYSTKTTAGFNPSDVGTYDLKVNVKDSNGNTVSKTFTVEVISLKNESTVSASSVSLGTRIVLTANASGGTAPYTYAYYYKKSSATSWTAFNKENGSAYSTKTSAGFNPSDAGKYDLRVNVKDSDGKTVSKIFTVEVISLKNESTVSASSVSLGTRIVLTANASGGTAPYTYAYYYKKSSASSWTAFNRENGSAYSTKTSTGFKPSDAGTYNLRINIKDSAGTVASKDFTVKIT